MLSGCASQPSFDPCPVTQERVIATLGMVVDEPKVSNLTERQSFGDVERWDCHFKIRETSPISSISFESIDAAEGEEYRDLYFDTAGELGDGVRTPRPEWGADAFIQVSSGSYLATFERDGRFWRFDAYVTGELGASPELESGVLELVEAAAQP